MVDCGNLRCFQERRSIRKELLSWSKKVPIVVGLETIAEYVGSRRKVRKLFEPFRCLESKVPVDWEPEENCIYCPDKVQQLIDTIEKTENDTTEEASVDDIEDDDGPSLPPHPNNSGRDILKDIKTAHNEPANPTSPLQEHAQSAESRLPILNGGLPVRDELNRNSPLMAKKGYLEDDLTTTVNDLNNGKVGSKRAGGPYGMPGLRNKMPRGEVDDSSSGSPYVDDDDSNEESSVPPPNELPFQTAQDRALQLHDLLQLSQMQYLAPISIPFLMRPDVLSTIENLEVEKRLQQVRHKHNLSKAPNNHYKEKARKYPLRPFQQELMKKLIRERLDIERMSAESMKQNSYIDMKSLTHSVILSALEGNSSRTLQHMKSHHDTAALDLYPNALSHSALLSALTIKPLLSPGLSGLENPASSSSHPSIVVPAYNPARSSSSLSVTTQSGSPKKQDSSLSSLSSITSDLTPSPSQVLFKYENTRIGDTLKDIIVKTISEKVKCKLEATDFSGLVGGSSTIGGQKAKETIMSAFSIPDGMSPPAKKIKREPLDSTISLKSNSAGNGNASNNNNNNSNGTQTKKTRPKRGQYRKYNSQLLTEAVKAVQRGEMSVHRAGSYYGVPHSTLEYKVKERHLLRQKKIKEQQEKKLKEAEEAKKNEQDIKIETPIKPSRNEKTKSDSSKLAADLLNITPQKSFPGPSWLPPFAGPSPFDSAAALGLFGSGFALSTPASELLRKLQHKVQN